MDEKLMLMYLPYALARVDKGLDLTKDELRGLSKQSTDFFSYIKNHSLDEHIALLVSYRNDSYFAQYIENILTPDGREWLARNYPIMKEVAME